MSTDSTQQTQKRKVHNPTSKNVDEILSAWKIGVKDTSEHGKFIDKEQQEDMDILAQNIAKAKEIKKEDDANKVKLQQMKEVKEARDNLVRMEFKEDEFKISNDLHNVKTQKLESTIKKQYETLEQDVAPQEPIKKTKEEIEQEFATPIVVEELDNMVETEKKNLSKDKINELKTSANQNQQQTKGTRVNSKPIPKVVESTQQETKQQDKDNKENPLAEEEDDYVYISPMTATDLIVFLISMTKAYSVKPEALHVELTKHKKYTLLEIYLFVEGNGKAIKLFSEKQHHNIAQIVTNVSTQWKNIRNEEGHDKNEKQFMIEYKK